MYLCNSLFLNIPQTQSGATCLAVKICFLFSNRRNTHGFEASNEINIQFHFEEFLSEQGCLNFFSVVVTVRPNTANNNYKYLQRCEAAFRSLTFELDIFTKPLPTSEEGNK